MTCSQVEDPTVTVKCNNVGCKIITTYVSLLTLTVRPGERERERERSTATDPGG